ncbi:NAD-dependent epimerase/dehydratase family protein [Humibacter ginsengisoli]
MILVTGGAGFIGSQVVAALCAMGEECVLVQRSRSEPPPRFAGMPVQLVRGDVNDLETFLAIGEHAAITGIVHLAGSMPWPPVRENAVESARRSLGSFFNLVSAAQRWSVPRVVTASTIGVYGGIEHGGALHEDEPVPLGHLHVIPTFKKIAELLGGYLASMTDVEIVQARISGTWGPGGHLPDPFFPASALVAAAARGIKPDLSGLLVPPRAGDGLDLSYVKDTGRAIALLQLADRLEHDVYNVGSGRATTNADVVDAIRTVVPGFEVDLPEGSAEPLRWLDISRLRQDTGYQSQYDTAAAAEDYIRWFRDGGAEGEKRAHL